jgi:hypothetical protein
MRCLSHRPQLRATAGRRFSSKDETKPNRLLLLTRCMFEPCNKRKINPSSVATFPTKQKKKKETVVQLVNGLPPQFLVENEKQPP